MNIKWECYILQVELCLNMTTIVDWDVKQHSNKHKVLLGLWPIFRHFNHVNKLSQNIFKPGPWYTVYWCVGYQMNFWAKSVDFLWLRALAIFWHLKLFSKF